MPWDRLGMFLGDLAAAGMNMTDRNLKLWSSVSQHLRQRPYKADDWAEDAARGMEAAMANVQEAWEAVVRAPERERVADTLPTAFVLFTPRVRDDGSIHWDPTDPVWMRLRGANLDQLPESAEIELSGDDPASVEALRQCLSTKFGPSRQAYLLQIGAVPELLYPGVYGGSVYVRQPNVRPIANLRIIVEKPPDIRGGARPA
jgi:hypothetical protein